VETISSLVEDEELGDPLFGASAGEVAIDDVGHSAGIEGIEGLVASGGLSMDKALPGEGNPFDGEVGPEEAGRFSFDAAAEVFVLAGVDASHNSPAVADKDPQPFSSGEAPAVEIIAWLGAGSGAGGRRSASSLLRTGADGATTNGARADQGAEGDVEVSGLIRLDYQGTCDGAIALSFELELVATDFDFLSVDRGIPQEFAVEFDAGRGVGVDIEHPFGFLDRLRGGGASAGQESKAPFVEARFRGTPSPSFSARSSSSA